VREILARPKIAVSVVFVLALFMSIMDTAIVNVALPSIGRDLRAAPAGVAAVSIGYLVSLAVVIPASGWLGDRFGGKRVMLFSIAVFTIASALCGFARSLDQLTGYRVLQGIGGGMMTPVGMAMLFRAFPPAERVRASGILTIPTTFAPAVGPLLGGVLVQSLDWRWVFFVNLPVGVLAFAYGLVFLTNDETAGAGRFDLPGFLLSGTGLAAVMFGLSERPGQGWGSPVIVGALAAGVVLLAALVLTQRRTSDPLLRLSLFQDRLFRSLTATMMLTMAAFLGLLYLSALFLQDGLGLSALNSGLSTFPEALGVLAGAQLASRLVYQRLGPRATTSGALVAIAVLIVSLTRIDGSGDLWTMRILLFLTGFAIGHVFVPAQAAAFARIPPRETPRVDVVQRFPPVGQRDRRRRGDHRAERGQRPAPRGGRPPRLPRRLRGGGGARAPGRAGRGHSPQCRRGPGTGSSPQLTTFRPRGPS
jgi:EmrB/QacA subfamily drug resistance transporter